LDKDRAKNINAHGGISRRASVRSKALYLAKQLILAREICPSNQPQGVAIRAAKPKQMPG
jgi:hypothetical protein